MHNIFCRDENGTWYTVTVYFAKTELALHFNDFAIEDVEYIKISVFEARTPNGERQINVATSDNKERKERRCKKLDNISRAYTHIS